MKLRILGLLFALPLFGYGCEDGDAPGEEETVAADDAAGADAADAAAGGGAGAAAEPAGPDAACAALIAAIKAKSVDDVVAASGEGAGEVVTAESIAGLATALGAGTCAEAKVEGNAAKVPVNIGDATQVLKFAKAGDEWKFDAKAWFAASTPPDEAGAKGKNKAKAGKAKAKAKGKGKGKAKGKK